MDDSRLRSGGAFLVLGVLLIVAGFLTETGDQSREAVADAPGTWAQTHVFLSAGMFALAIGAGVLALANALQSGAAWVTASLCALLMAVAFAIEASAIPVVATNAQSFDAWRSLTNFLVMALAPFSLAVAAIAWADARAPERLLPRGLSYAVIPFACLGAVGVVGDAVHVTVIAYLLPAALLGILYLAALGIRVNLPKRNAGPRQQAQ